MRRVKDLSGKKFHRWTVIKQFSSNPVLWLCRCDCGAVRPVAGRSLKNGGSKSCGCLRKFTNKIRTVEPKVEKVVKLELAEISRAVGVGVGRFNFIATSEGMVDRKLFIEKGDVLVWKNVENKEYTNGFKVSTM